jgi:GT2 family glycosyltransferase
VTRVVHGGGRRPGGGEGAGESRVAVIVLTRNQKDTTLSFLGSFPSETNVPLLLWDNGSTDGTAPAVEAAFPSVRVHRHSTNLGVASGRNAAASLALEAWSPTHLLFLDNDLELTPGFIEALLAVFEDPAVGQAQAKLRFLHDRRRLNDGGGCRINYLTGATVPVGYGEIDKGQHDQIKPCVSCGGAMMVRSDVFQGLGGFDATFDPFGPEDLDFSLRLQKAGYRALYVPQALAFHAVSHTFGAGYSEDYARHKARHWLVFLNRHGTRLQRFSFYLFSAPILVLRIAVREARRGNLGAVRGLFAGALDRLRGREGG